MQNNQGCNSPVKESKRRKQIAIIWHEFKTGDLSFKGPINSPETMPQQCPFTSALLTRRPGIVHFSISPTERFGTYSGPAQGILLLELKDTIVPPFPFNCPSGQLFHHTKCQQVVYEIFQHPHNFVLQEKGMVWAMM